MKVGNFNRILCYAYISCRVNFYIHATHVQNVLHASDVVCVDLDSLNLSLV